jgi:hypothetical protein
MSEVIFLEACSKKVGFGGVRSSTEENHQKVWSSWAKRGGRLKSIEHCSFTVPPHHYKEKRFNKKKKKALRWQQNSSHCMLNQGVNKVTTILYKVNSVVLNFN